MRRVTDFCCQKAEYQIYNKYIALIITYIVQKAIPQLPINRFAAALPVFYTGFIQLQINFAKSSLLLTQGSNRAGEDQR